MSFSQIKFKAFAPIGRKENLGSFLKFYIYLILCQFFIKM